MDCLIGHGWTLKKLQHWLKQVMGYDLARSTLAPHSASSAVALEDSSPKNVQESRHTATCGLYGTLSHSCMHNSIARRSVWSMSDEPPSASTGDMDLGYTWTRKNQIAWRMSDSAHALGSH